MARKRISKTTVGRDAGRGAGMPMRSIDVNPASPLLELQLFAPQAPDGRYGSAEPSQAPGKSESEPRGSVIVIDLC